MTNVLHTLCLVVGGAILLHKLRGLVSGKRDIVAVSLCIYFGLSTLSYLVLLPPVYVLIDGFTGMPNSAGMCSGVSVLGLTAAQQFLLMHWTYPRQTARRKIRLRLVLGGLILVVYLVTFFVFAPMQQRFSDFYLRYTQQLMQAPYLVIYTLACLIGQTDVVRHCWRYAEIADRAWLRRGMRTTAFGGAIILVYGVLRVCDLVAGPLGIDLRDLEPVVWLCGDIGSVLALTGWVLPTAGARLSALAGWARAYRDYCRLYPLWNALYQVVPSVALDPPSSRFRDLLRVRNTDFWLHRRVVEIQDAQRALFSRPGDAGALAVRESRVRAAMVAASQRVGRKAEFAAPATDRDFQGEIKWLTGLTAEFFVCQRGSH